MLVQQHAVPYRKAASTIQKMTQNAESLRRISSNLVNVGFPGKPSIQGYPHISGCFDPLDLPSEEPKGTGVRNASPWRREQHFHTH